MVINTNLQSQAASSSLSQSSAMLARSLARLSSGSKITNASDDTAGSAVSMKLNGQIKRIDAAASNIGNAISFSQTQDGYLQKMSDTLARMSELSVMAQDITKTDADRALYSQEFKQLGQDVGNIANAQFNGVSLFSANGLDVTTDGEGNTFVMAGINLSSITYSNILNDRVNIIGDMSTGAVYAMNDLKRIIKQLASDRAVLGANIERLKYHGDQMSTLKDSLSAANSRITDVDVAQESTTYAKYNILVQSGTAMLAQANSLPQSVLKLLG